VNRPQLLLDDDRTPCGVMVVFVSFDRSRLGMVAGVVAGAHAAGVWLVGRLMVRGLLGFSLGRAGGWSCWLGRVGSYVAELVGGCGLAGVRRVR
jgi:hypothetical protein